MKLSNMEDETDGHEGVRYCVRVSIEMELSNIEDEK